MTSFDKIMTQEEKELLLEDLCTRLPYGVKAQVKYPINTNGECIITTKEITSVNCGLDMVQAENIDIIVGYYIFEVKPYLFPMSSMTNEQKIRISALQDMGPSYYHCIIDRYNEWHIDYRNLIGKGLANDATGLNIY